MEKDSTYEPFDWEGDTTLPPTDWEVTNSWDYTRTTLEKLRDMVYPKLEGFKGKVIICGTPTGSSLLSKEIWEERMASSIDKDFDFALGPWESKPRTTWTQAPEFGTANYDPYPTGSVRNAAVQAIARMGYTASELGHTLSSLTVSLRDLDRLPDPILDYRFIGIPGYSDFYSYNWELLKYPNPYIYSSSPRTRAKQSRPLRVHIRSPT